MKVKIQECDKKIREAVVKGFKNSFASVYPLNHLGYPASYSYEFSWAAIGRAKKGAVLIAG